MSFTTGAVAVLDRHHTQLPVVGVIRVKEPTTKLRRKIEAGGTRILRVTLASEGSKTYVSFGVVAKMATTDTNPTGVASHDVGITRLITSSDGSLVENPSAGGQARKQISRYQRRMDRQHRAASPECFNEDGTHIAGVCHWKDRSRRAQENTARPEQGPRQGHTHT